MWRSFVLLVAGLLAVAVIVVSVLFGVSRAVDNAVYRDAFSKAAHWSEFMTSILVDLERLTYTGVPNAEQHEIISTIQSFGGVFRFNLFSTDARLALVSDDIGHRTYRGIVLHKDLTVLNVMKTREPFVKLMSGNAENGWPELYAEAYVPLVSEHGNTFGAVKIYIDQTNSHLKFSESFRMFGFAIAALSAIIFAVPSLAFYLQRRIALKSRKNAEILARFDPLTGLMNRREFVEQATATTGRAEGLSFLCYLDLDNFKSINDTKGHAVGDAFLVHIAKIIKRNCTPGDIAARFGGDEFVIGFSDITREKVELRVKGILKSCAGEFQCKQDSVLSSVSIGVAKIIDGDCLDDILKKADAALYYAKAAGRNDFAFYGQEMGAEIERRRMLEARLLDATKNKEFYIHYQPLVSSADQSVMGYEALLRLQDIHGENVPPSVFIPVAEELGLIDEIGEWTLRTAIQEIKEASEDIKLAVNLSAKQFKSGLLGGMIAEILTETGFDPKRLELEVTETLLLDDCKYVEMQIDTLKELGVQIAMDDFGTGFSSLSYLWKYGFDRLKIDRSFVSALQKNPEKSREIIEAIVMLGSKLNMKITAEGVETLEQLQLLTSLGCDTLQGFYFGRPSSLDQFEDTASQHLETEKQRRIS